DDADDAISLLEQELGEVGPVLSRDAGDQRRLHGVQDRGVGRIACASSWARSAKDPCAAEERSTSPRRTGVLRSLRSLRMTRVRAVLRDGVLAARRALHLAGVHAARADLHLLDLAVDLGAHHLQVRLPGAARLVVRVRDVVPERDALAAAIADVSLN